MTPVNLSYQCYQYHFIGLISLKKGSAHCPEEEILQEVVAVRIVISVSSCPERHLLSDNFPWQFVPHGSNHGTDVLVGSAVWGTLRRCMGVTWPGSWARSQSLLMTTERCSTRVR